MRQGLGAAAVCRAAGAQHAAPARARARAAPRLVRRAGLSAARALQGQRFVPFFPPAAPPLLPTHSLLGPGMPSMVTGVVISKQVTCVCDLGYYGTFRPSRPSLSNPVERSNDGVWCRSSGPVPELQHAGERVRGGRVPQRRHLLARRRPLQLLLRAGVQRYAAPALRSHGSGPFESFDSPVSLSECENVNVTFVRPL